LGKRNEKLSIKNMGKNSVDNFSLPCNRKPDIKDQVPAVTSEVYLTELPKPAKKSLANNRYEKNKFWKPDGYKKDHVLVRHIAKRRISYSQVKKASEKREK
jgi:hypothetical protein